MTSEIIGNEAPNVFPVFAATVSLDSLYLDTTVVNTLYLPGRSNILPHKDKITFPDLFAAHTGSFYHMIE